MRPPPALAETSFEGGLLGELDDNDDDDEDDDDDNDDDDDDGGELGEFSVASFLQG